MFGSQGYPKALVALLLDILSGSGTQGLTRTDSALAKRKVTLALPRIT